MTITFDRLRPKPLCYGSSIPDNTYFIAGDAYLWHKNGGKYFKIVPEGILLREDCGGDTHFFDYMRVDVTITVMRDV